ncbi:transketolase, partial [candidate division WOR-3 bacterium]|nr:transketolase [candidate division WOR-3 bacterium]
SFGWHVIEIDGHNFEEISRAFKEFKTIKGKPTVIIAHTIKGKGVSFMENNVEWHGKAPDKIQRDQAVKELERNV